MNLVKTIFTVLLALTQLSLSAPTILDVTAEEFANMKDIVVRSNDPSANSTDSNLVCPPTVHYRYTKEGNNGNAHQNFVITQKGGTLITCPGHTAKGHSTTLGWSISAGVNSEFNSAGFSVSKSQTYSTTQTFDCAADTHEICILFYQAVTAFGVNVKKYTDQCPGEQVEDLGHHVVYAPNSDQKGSTVARGINAPQHGVKQCVGNADRRINYYCGPPGGPEWWDGKDQGPFHPAYVNNRKPDGCDIPIEANHYNDK